jgi:hypothetical protein
MRWTNVLWNNQTYRLMRNRHTRCNWAPEVI